MKNPFHVLVIAAAVIACDTVRDQPAPEPADSVADTLSMPAPIPKDTLDGGRTFFDPRHLTLGAVVAGLKVDRLDLRPAELPTNYSGMVRFAGEVELKGIYRAHHDYPEVNAACFFVDEASWPKLPRARGDSRILWLCFENFQEAVEELGPLGGQSRATIVIDKYTTNLSGSDAWDTARLIRVVNRTEIQ